MSQGREARARLRRRHHAMLSTTSAKLEGYPFGSVVPYVLDHDGQPVILVSRLAEHTRNIEADSRVSLLVTGESPDVQANARVTLVGDARRCGDQERPRGRYLRFFPDAARLIALGDFAFYTIAPRAIRHIGGFGDIQWISAEVYAPPANRFAEQEEDIVAQMNAHYARSLRDYCRHYHGTSTAHAVMIGIDCDGFDVRANGAPPLSHDRQAPPDIASAAGPPPGSDPNNRAPASPSGVLLRFDFEQPLTDAATALEALGAMAKSCQGA